MAKIKDILAIACAMVGSLSFGEITAVGNWYTTDSTSDHYVESLDNSVNALYGLTTSFTAGGIGSELLDANIAVMTDGTIWYGGVYADYEYTIRDNTTMEWTWDTAKTLDDIRIFTCWGTGPYRNDIVVCSLAVRDVNGDWVTIIGSSENGGRYFAFCNSEHVSNVLDANGKTMMTDAGGELPSRYLRIYDDVGLPIYRAITGMRLGFADQDHGYGGYTEIQALSHVDDWKTLENVKYVSANNDAVVSGDYLTFNSPGTIRILKTVHLVSVDSDANTKDIGYFIAGDEYDVIPPTDGWTRIEISEMSSSEIPLASIGAITGVYETKVTGDYTAYIFTNTAAVASLEIVSPGTIDLLAIGGGGAGGYLIGGGGGAGAVYMVRNALVDSGVKTITIGDGGVSSTSSAVNGPNGGDTIFGNYRAVGGGAGASWHRSIGSDGGSGGGAAGGDGNYTLYNGSSTARNGSLGNDGGKCYSDCGGGGGGAGSAGGNGNVIANTGGEAGQGIQCDYSGTMTWYAAGGGAGCGNGCYYASNGANGIGGNGAALNSGLPGTAGLDGTGSGGGGGGYSPPTAGGEGGSGIVIVRVFTGDVNSIVPAGYIDECAVVSGTSVKFKGNVYRVGAGAASCALKIKYGITPTKLAFERTIGDFTTAGLVDLSLDNLRPGLTYYMKAFLDNGKTNEVAISQAFEIVTPAETTSAETITLLGMTMKNDIATVAVTIPADAAGDEESVYYATSYVGAGTTGWTKISDDLITIKDGPNGSREFTFAMPNGAAYVRITAKNSVLAETTAIPVCEIAASEYSTVRYATSGDIIISGGKYTTGEFGPFVYYKLLDTTAAYSINLTESGKIDYLLIGGGGGGAGTVGGGGGGGGFVWRKGEYNSAGIYSASVGAGVKSDSQSSTTDGGETTFGTVIAYGGASGTGYYCDTQFAYHNDGASGGGGGDGSPAGKAIYGDQGYDGGASYYMTPGGGGGAGGEGETPVDNSHAGNGGIGRLCSITGVNTYYAGGGGGGGGIITWGYSSSGKDVSYAGSAERGLGGLGGGGNGSVIWSGLDGVSGTDGLGGGGGGGSYGSNGGTATAGGKGGDGVIILRVLKQGNTSIEPYGLINSIVATGADYVDVDWSLLYCGYNSTGGNLVVKYGFSQAALDHTFEVKTVTGEDAAVTRITGLAPGTHYCAKFYLDNGCGEGYVGATGMVFEFTTTSDVTDASAFDIASAIQSDGTVTLTANVADELDEADFAIGFATTYDGEWTWQTIDAITGNINVEIPDGAAYVRIKAEFGGETWYSASKTIADIEVVDFDAIGVTYSSVSDITSVQATINALVISTGSDDACAVIVKYGLDIEKLIFEQDFEELKTGAVQLRLKGLTPNRVYYATIQAINDSEETSAVSSVFSFTTATLADDSTPVPNDTTMSWAGLWQACGTNQSYPSSVTEDSSCVLVDGTMCALTLSSGSWTAIDQNGDEVSCDWNGYRHYVYQGYIYLEKADYYFMGFASSDCELYINNQIMWNSNSIVEYDNSNGVAGWYPIMFKMYNIGANTGGPHNGVIAAGWRIGETASWSEPDKWNAFLDTGDGALLRTSIPLRDGTITSSSISLGELDVSITIATGDEMTLCVVFGDDYYGNDPADWTASADVATIGATTTQYEYSASVNSNYRYARFYLTDGERIQWVKGVVFLPDPSTPAFSGAVTIDGNGGDTIMVRGTIASVGSGATASLKAYVSESMDMTNPIEWDLGTVVSGEELARAIHVDDTTSSNYITPGSTHYVRVKLIGANEMEDITEVMHVTTAAAHAIATDSFMITTTTYQGHYSYNITEVGANGSWLIINSGATAETMTNVYARLITEAEQGTVTIDYPFIKETIYSQIIVSNGCATASWVDSSAISSNYLKDNLVYRWKASVHDGVWSDPNNWETDAGFRTTYPNSTDCEVQILTDDISTETRIFVDGNYYMNTISFPITDMKVLIEGTTYVGSASRLNVPFSNADWTYRLASGLQLTLKKVLFDATGMYFSNNMYLTLDNAFYNVGRGPTWSASNVTIELKNDALWQQINDHDYMDGSNLHIIVNDSTFWNSCGGAIYQGWSIDGVNGVVFDLYGDHPLVKFRNSWQAGCNTHTLTSDMEVIFHIPEGGYESTPLQFLESDFMSANSLSGIKLSVASDSPALTGGKKVETKLVETAGNLGSDKITLSSAIRKADLSYGAEEPARTIWATIKAQGLTVIIK